jgi:hypothetical protein
MTLDALFQQDGAPSRVLQDVHNFLDNHYPGRWIGCGGHITWPPRSLDLTPLDFTLWGFVKDIIYVPPMPNSTEELKIQISQAMLTADEKMLDKIGAELEYCWDTCCVTKTAHIDHLQTHVK